MSNQDDVSLVYQFVNQIIMFESLKMCYLFTCFLFNEFIYIEHYFHIWNMGRYLLIIIFFFLTYGNFGLIYYLTTLIYSLNLGVIYSFLFCFWFVLFNLIRIIV